VRSAIAPPSSAWKTWIDPGKALMRVLFAISTSFRVGKSSVGSMLSLNCNGRCNALNLDIESGDKTPVRISFNMVTKSGFSSRPGE
jgi:hypothetical protein